MDPDEEAPPPYSAVDPLASQTNNRTALLRLRGGNAPRRDASPASTERPSSSLTIATPLPPANFTSAAAYFVERPPPVFDAEQPFLEHQLTIYHRSQAKDFPRRPKCWGPRNNHITQQDWDTFLKYLFPPHLGLASSSGQLPPRLRVEIQRDRKDRPQETDEQRRMRVSAVITEWNQYFFEPRAARLVFIYVTDPQNAPLSPLCPRCYPAATKATQENRSALTPAAGPGRLTQPGLPPVPGQPTPQAPLGYPFAAPYAYPNTPISPVPFAPYGAAPLHTAAAHHPYPYYPQQPLPYHQWGWNAQPWPPQQPNPSPTKGGALGWLADLASEAQRYGERITERAERYSDQISAEAGYYSRQVGEQLTHGRWIEEQPGFGGHKTQEVFMGFNQPPPTPTYHHPPNAPYGPAAPAVHRAETTTTPTTANPPATPSAQRPRRASTTSISSDSSFSSINSLSTTSELSSSDLATVRAQLLSLNEYHDRDLHEAALGLRCQLDNLRASRRQTRQAGRSNSWRNGFGHLSQSQPQRWESPQQHQRSKAERRAVKEETRATRKAFREVLRRAREEQRERRRMVRNNRRQQTRQPSRADPAVEVALDQRLQNLELDQNHRESQSTVQSYPSPRSVSEISEVSPISTPSTVSSQGQTSHSGSQPGPNPVKSRDKLSSEKKGM